MASLPDYLKKYVQGPSKEKPSKDTDKKKKKKEKSKKTIGSGFVVVDQTTAVEAPTLAKTEEAEEDEEFKPVVAQYERSGRKTETDGSSGGWVEIKKGTSQPRNPSEEKLLKSRHDSEDENVKDNSSRRQRHDSGDEATNISPPRKSRHDSEDERGLSPPRRTRHDSEDEKDLSPPRRGRHDSEDEGPKDLSPPRNSSAQKAQIDDKNSKKRVTEAEVVTKAEMKQKLDADEEENMEWGVGRVQKKEKIDQAALLEEAKNMAFARYADDEKMNREFKSQHRWGDPLAGKSTSSRASSVLEDDEDTSAKAKKSKKKKKSVPRRWHCAPPVNRFNILPGPMWDGVDRSNGFEVKIFEVQNSKKALEEKAYLWSVEDM